MTAIYNASVQKVIFFGAKHNRKTSIRRLAECVRGIPGMVSFFPARRPGTRAGKNDDVRMLKGKLPQMNHFLVRFDCYLQRVCPKSDFFWSQTQSKNVESVRSFPSFRSLRRWGQKPCGRGRVTRAGNRDDGSMQWQTPSNESLSCSL